MRIVIAGAGEVGLHLAKMLSNENHDIVVIDNDEDSLRIASAGLDLLIINGSATSFASLQEANIKKADLFIAVTHTEQINIAAGILSKNMGAAKVIARIDNQEYLDPKNIQQLNALGLDYLIFPEAIAAKEIVDLLHQTGSSEMVDFCGGKILLYVIKVEENAPIIGRTLAENFKKEISSDEYRIVSIKRDGVTIMPKGDDIFEASDLLYVISTPKGIDDLMTLAGKEKYSAKNVMILGGSRIGKITAEELGSHHNIKMIEIKREKCYALSNQLQNTLVIHGDGRDMDLLNEEKLEKMDAFVALTGSSETNILACLHAKRLGVKKTIAEVENFNYIDLAESLGIDAIINKKIGAASRIFRFTASSARVANVKCLRGIDAEVVEFVANTGAKITKAAIKDLNLPKDFIIGGIVRGEDVLIPKGETLLEASDRVIVFALPSVIKEVGKLFS